MGQCLGTGGLKETPAKIEDSKLDEDQDVKGLVEGKSDLLERSYA